MSVTEKIRLRAAPVLPPHPNFSLSWLPDDAHLTQAEVAAVKRQTKSWTEKGRLAETERLGMGLYRARQASALHCRYLKKQMAGTSDKGPAPTMKAKKKPAKRGRAR